MNFRIEVICVRDDGTEERREVMTVTKEQLAMETLGLTVAEGKELLVGRPDRVWWKSKRQPTWRSAVHVRPAGSRTAAKSRAGAR